MNEALEPSKPDMDRPDALPGVLWLYAGRAGQSAVRLRPADLRQTLAGKDWVWLMPGTLVVGFFGMNTSALPLGTYGALFLAGAAAVLFYRILKRAGASIKF